MSIEKNVVFIFPLVPLLQEIKTELEEDDSYVIYEMDSLSEYKQLIGILEHVITFSSDMKKTSRYLQENKQFILREDSLNIAVSKTTIPPHTFGKLQRFGLDEVFKDNVHKKSLNHKVETFFKRFEVQEEQVELEKQKASINTDVLIMNKEDNSNKFDTESKQRVERMMAVDEGPEDINRKKVNMHGLNFDDSQGGNLVGRSKNNFNPAMGVLKRKNVKTLDLQALDKLKKRGTFTPVDKELQRKKGLLFDSKEAQLKRKKLDLPDIGKEGALGKKLELPGVKREMDWKKLEPKEAREGVKGKKLDLPGVNREMEWKKLEPKEAREGAQGKKLNLPGVNREMDWKKLEPKEAREGAQGKKLDLPGVNREMDWKKQEDKEKKQGATGKKLDLPGVEREVERKALKSNEIPANRKNNTNLEEEEIQKKKKATFEEVEIDRSIERNKAKEEKLEKKKKKGHFEEINIERGHGKGKTEYIEKNYGGKSIGSTLDRNKSRDNNAYGLDSDTPSREGLKILGKKTKEKSEYEEEIIKLNKKDWGEQTLDYRKLKKQYQDKNSGLSEEEVLNSKKRLADKIAQTPEINYYYPALNSIEFLVHIDSFFLNPKMDNLSCLKFIQFTLLKTLNATVTFYQYKAETFHSLYSSHLKEDISLLGINDWETYEKELITELIEVELPEWSDTTYRAKINLFIYPYFHDGVLLGHAVAHFNNSIHHEADTQKAELFLLCAKGIYMQLDKDSE